MCEILHVNMSTLLRRCLRTKPIKQTLVVTGGGEDALNTLSDLLEQCVRIGSNLNQFARHFNSGGKDSEQIRAQLLTELSLHSHSFGWTAEKKMGRTVWQTIKHTSSKNSDLTAPEHYLTFQHNEYTGLPLLDKNGRAQTAGGVLTGHPGMRRAVLCHGLPAGKPEVRKELLSRRCEDPPVWQHPPKWMNADLCGAHTYSHIGHHVTDIIISFDPRDAADNGLTLEKAQALACSSVRKTFRVIPPLSAPTPTGTTELGISTFTLSSAASEYGPSRGSPIWKSPVTGRRA